MTGAVLVIVGVILAGTFARVVFGPGILAKDLAGDVIPAGSLSHIQAIENARPDEQSMPAGVLMARMHGARNAVQVCDTKRVRKRIGQDDAVRLPGGSDDDDGGAVL